LPLLDSVKRKLATEEVTHTERMLGIVKEETERILNAWRTHPQIESWIGQTGWIFSYTTLLNNQPHLRVGIFHPSLSKESHAVYEVGEPAIIFPVELDQETATVVCDSILQGIKLPTDLSELQSSIAQNSAVIGAVVNALQPYCPSISRRFQVGIHSGGRAGISNLIDIHDDGILSFDIRLDDGSSD